MKKEPLITQAQSADKFERIRRAHQSEIAEEPAGVGRAAFDLRRARALTAVAGQGRISRHPQQRGSTGALSPGLARRCLAVVSA